MFRTTSTTPPYSPRSPGTPRRLPASTTGDVGDVGDLSDATESTAAERIAEALDLALASGPGVYGVVESGAGLSIAPTDWEPIPEALFGRRAPIAWHGLAVVASGTATDALGGRQRCRSGCLVLRDGSVLGAIDREGIPIVRDPGVEGVMVDACRRVLGLPCPPEDATVAEWVSARWLTALLDLAADPASSGLLPDFAAAAAIHPLFDGTSCRRPEVLAHRCAATLPQSSWARVRELVGEGAAVECMSPEHARWMDDPFFARSLLGCYRGVTDLVDDLSLFVDGAFMEAVETVLVASGWLGFAPHHGGSL